MQLIRTNRLTAEHLEAIFAGNGVLLDPNTQTQALAQAAMAQIQQALAGLVLDQHHNDRFFAAMGAVRRHLYQDARYAQLQHRLIAKVLGQGANTWVEGIKLRALAPWSHQIKAAEPVFYAHRDTWYGYPQGLLNWWLPLVPVDASNGFCFYPEYFNAAIDNDSADFDTQGWRGPGATGHIGWQPSSNSAKAQVFPRALMPLDKANRVYVECHAGALLLFSGHQLHQSQVNQSGQLRLSLDFRTLTDGHIGPQNFDNQSQVPPKLAGFRSLAP